MGQREDTMHHEHCWSGSVAYFSNSLGLFGTNDMDGALEGHNITQPSPRWISKYMFCWKPCMFDARLIHAYTRACLCCRHKFDTNSWDRCRTAACSVNNTHTCEHMHGSIQHQTCMVPGKIRTYWSIWVMSELYYVLPTLHPCHLWQIIPANSRNRRLSRTGNIHGALCLLSYPIILIRR